MGNSNYSCTSNVTCTIDTGTWHEVTVPGNPFASVVIRDWLLRNKGGLVGGYLVSGNSLRLQRREDVTFFKMSISQ